ncbi:hypothetical protein HL653_23215 [Sphingomonas sp. AP4-R1]|uniref:hypothetical protein n=1 Tax=Sphingomonas sp. AP4-R1 TaxID=2735134 RepID=UPI001493D469|nr:hypothetical protein [Sphingomonas sp. AP4-R1]QJU60256.1 hypothetical protein HL653_23215 [Sphingomonas sp. AP4-R1]
MKIDRQTVKTPRRMRAAWRALTLAALAPVPAASAPPALHSLVIQSSETLQIAPKEDKEWYEKGVWPLVGAGVTLAITNAIALWIVHLQAGKTFKATLKQRKIDQLSASLSEFYNPLLALIDINGEIFDKTSKKAWPEDEAGREAAALVWVETKKKVLANNLVIETILRTKTHLMSETDSLASYQPLLLHVAMYETFQTVQTDLYKKFMFPASVRSHLVDQRSTVLSAYYETSGDKI